MMNWTAMDDGITMIGMKLGKYDYQTWICEGMILRIWDVVMKHWMDWMTMIWELLSVPLRVYSFPQCMN